LVIVFLLSGAAALNRRASQGFLTDASTYLLNRQRAGFPTAKPSVEFTTGVRVGPCWTKSEKAKVGPRTCPVYDYKAFLSFFTASAETARYRRVPARFVRTFLRWNVHLDHRRYETKFARRRGEPGDRQRGKTVRAMPVPLLRIGGRPLL
jgi:hypothetical protein